VTLLPDALTKTVLIDTTRAVTIDGPKGLTRFSVAQLRGRLRFSNASFWP
jgi:hypothetical protein